MNSGSRRRYAVRVAGTRIPRVDVVTHVQDFAPGGFTWRTVEYDQVVKRCYGFTTEHAMNRALRWMDADN